MKQVYIALTSTEKKQYLVVKKRVRNSFWQGSKWEESKLVNQAGEFAFPGGDMKSDSPITAAIREFKKESGYDLDGLLNTESAKKFEVYEIQLNKSFVLVELVVPPDWLKTIYRAVHNNVQPNLADYDKPRGSNVEDWEWQQVILMKKEELTKYLGVSQVTPQEKETYKQERKGGFSQEIDWYATMAKHLAQRKAS